MGARPGGGEMGNVPGGAPFVWGAGAGERGGGLKERGKFAAWLRRIAFSTCMDWLRTFRPEAYRAMGEPGDVDAVQEVDAGPVEAVEKKELAEVVLGAIAKLPAKYRIPITMFHL